MAENNITVMAACTACTRQEGHLTFFSHCAEQGRTGRMMGLIGIAPEPAGTAVPSTSSGSIA